MEAGVAKPGLRRSAEEVVVTLRAAVG